jgi:hypothetical protein
MNAAIEAIVPELASQSNRPPARLNDAKLFASWQSGPETLTGFAQWKLRLELMPCGRAQIANRKLRERDAGTHQH